MADFSGYSEEIKKALSSAKAEAGHKIAIEKDGKIMTGLVMPRVSGDPSSVIIKMDNGYNVGIKFAPGVKISKAKEDIKDVRKAPAAEAKRPKAAPADPQKPTIAILHTGGTIASKLDYRTGAVVPLFMAEDIVDMYPELKDIANIRVRVLFQMFSEDMEPEHWQIIAREVYHELTEEGADGIIIMHGTDTLYYTSAALAFMLRDLPVPVILTASQRSSDRPSSDARMNLISAARFIADSDWSGVGICMHATPSDETCWILPPCRVRKMHSSRRDAFRPMNTKPVAEIKWATRAIEFFQKDYPKKDMKRVPKLFNQIDPAVGLFKAYPGMKADQLDWFEKNCSGLLIEGFAFGQMPVNKLDNLTAHHPELLKKLAALSKKMPVYVASQVPYGRVNMNVYSTTRDMLAAGVKPAYMQGSTAYIKLIWALGQTKDRKKVDELMQQDIAGEIISRSEHTEFPDEGMEK